MAAIYKNQAGFLLISTLVILSIMIVIVSFYLSGILQEARVAQITAAAPQTYYLAEAGISELLWKLGHDSSWENSFENNASWTGTISRSNTPVANGSYTVTIQNQGVGNAVITATSTTSFRDGTAQRVLQMAIFKPLNTNPVNGVTVFGNNGIKSTGGELTVSGGDIFTNKDIKLEYYSAWSNNQKAEAVGYITTDVSSTLTASSINDADSPPNPSEIQMITIDFSSGESTSYYARADQIYTASQFSQLLTDNPSLTLTGITYVTGNAHIERGQTVTVNGALVADGTITVGNGNSTNPNPAVLDVNKVGNNPSGLLSRKNIIIGGSYANVTIDGLVYTGGNFRVQDGDEQDVNVAITGGVFAQTIELYHLWDPITITHNQSYINEARPVSSHSQTVIVNHWEEQY